MEASIASAINGRALTASAVNGGERVRTDDPLLAKQVLSQLSYTPTNPPHSPQAAKPEDHWWAREDLNLRPHAYQACALTS